MKTKTCYVSFRWSILDNEHIPPSIFGVTAAQLRVFPDLVFVWVVLVPLFSLRVPPILAQVSSFSSGPPATSFFYIKILSETDSHGIPMKHQNNGEMSINCWKQYASVDRILNQQNLKFTLCSFVLLFDMLLDLIPHLHLLVLQEHHIDWNENYCPVVWDQCWSKRRKILGIQRRRNNVTTAATTTRFDSFISHLYNCFTSTPPDSTPTPLGQHLPGQQTRYASYWNAFLHHKDNHIKIKCILST